MESQVRGPGPGRRRSPWGLAARPARARSVHRAASTTEAPDLLLGGLGSTLGSTVSKVLSITDLLTCRALPYASTTRTIGRDGGVVVVGQYSLKIPAGALKNNVQIRAEQVSGRVNSVRFSPEGLKFATPGHPHHGIQELLPGAPAQAHRLHERAAEGAGAFFGRWISSATGPSPRRSTTSPGTPSRTEDVTSDSSSFSQRGAAQDTGPSRAGALLGDARGHERAGAILEALACYDESIRCAEARCRRPGPG